MKKIYALLFLILSLTGSAAFSQSGVLDATFGTGGKVVTQTGDSSSVANAVVITSAGKILVGGQSFTAGQSLATLLQYNSDGTLDSSFGLGGKASLSSPVAGGWSSINSIALKPDGKIIAVGYYSPYYIEPLIARFKPNGSLDSTFGVNGKAPTIIIDSGLYAGYTGGAASKVVIKPDGKIVVGGATYTMFFVNVPSVLQYLPNGTIDSSFGTNGGTPVGIGAPYVTVDNVNDMAVTADGKILTAINEHITVGILGRPEVQLDRLLSNGLYDSTFGTDGVVRTGNDTMWRGGDAYGVVALPDSSIVATGYLSTSTELLLALLKYHSDGTPDSTFGINGKVVTQLTGYVNDVRRILLLPDGKLLMSGYTYPSRNFLLVKFLPDGTLDSSFGTNGITITDFSGNSDISYSSALQPDGKIVLVGSTGTNTNYNIALARYNNPLVVPLHLLSFTATKNETVNLLQWQTAQEINTSLFEVQRSSNGKEYNTIGYVNAGNNPYHFTDNQPFNGNNYYRLKMIDKNGSFTYSPVRIITSTNAFTVKVYPNPVKDNLQLQITSDKETTVQWSIISADGKTLLSGQWNVPAGSSAKEIRLTSLQKGTYFLSSATTGKKHVINRIEKL